MGPGPELDNLLDFTDTGRSNLEVADISKHEDLGMTGQEADVRDIAEDCEEDEGQQEESDPEPNWQDSGVDESGSIATEYLLWREIIITVQIVII